MGVIKLAWQEVWGALYGEGVCPQAGDSSRFEHNLSSDMHDVTNAEH